MRIRIQLVVNSYAVPHPRFTLGVRDLNIRPDKPFCLAKILTNLKVFSLYIVEERAHLLCSK